MMMSNRKSVEDDKRRVNWVSLTYPSDRERVEHLYSLVVTHNVPCVCWCVHDMDTDEHGELKEVHCHTVIHLKNGMTASAFSENFCIRPRMFEPAYKDGDIKKLDDALLYLIHADEGSKAKGKYQYPIEKIKGPWASYARERITYLLSQPSKEIKESQSFFAIVSFIDSSLYLNISTVAKWAASHGHWSNFRRSSSIFRDIIREHNEELRQNDIKRDMDTLTERMNERNQIESLYEAIGIRTLRALDGMLENAGRPSLKLKSQIAYVDEVVHKSKGQVNTELIKEIMNGEKEKAI